MKNKKLTNMTLILFVAIFAFSCSQDIGVIGTRIENNYIPVDPDPPIAPTLSDPQTGNEKIALSWSQVAAESYEVFYGEESGNYSQSFVVDKTNAEIENLTNDQEYFFAVKATNQYGVSGYSNEVFGSPVADPIPNDLIFEQFGTSQRDNAGGIAINHKTGDIYIVGTSEGELMSGYEPQGQDLFLVKYNSNMQRVWIKQWGTFHAERFRKILLDSDGNVYIGGITYGDIDGDGGMGSDNFFVTKLDSNGNEIWVEQIENDGSQELSDMTFDKNGNIFVAGTSDTAFYGHESLGGDDAFLMKFDPSGNVLYSKVVGTNLDDDGVGVVVDSANNYYIIGRTQGVYDGQEQVGGLDMFVTKFAPDGFKILSRQFGSPDHDRPKSAEIDNLDNIYIFGHASRDFMGNEMIGGSDVFILQMNTIGEVQWADLFGTVENEDEEDVVITGSGEIYITGYTRGAFEGSSSSGADDAFLTKYNSVGSKLYTVQFGTDGYDLAKGVAVDSNGSVLVAGYTSGEFGVFTSSGSDDIFIATLPSGY